LKAIWVEYRAFYNTLATGSIFVAPNKTLY